MKPTAKYVGLDVHQSTSVAVVLSETGRVLTRKVLATEERAILAFLRGMRGSLHLALEEGTQAQWLRDLVAPEITRVIVCDRRGRAHGNKDDARDAEELAEDLRQGRLRAVYHGPAGEAMLKEVARTYLNLVEDGTRVRLRLKALYRARGIRVKGSGVYRADQRAEWLAKLTTPGAQFRAAALYEQLDALLTWRPQVKAAFLREAKRDPAYQTLCRIPFLGPVRVGLLLATLRTPWRFRTKRQLWTYAGLAVVVRDTAQWTLTPEGRPQRRGRPPMTRGLNRNHNRVMKAVFKSAATAAAAKPGELQDFYQAMLARGMREELARVTLARKLAAIVLHIWKTGERYDPAKLSVRAR